MKLDLFAKAVSGVALAAAFTAPAHADYVVLDGWELVTPSSDTKSIGHLVLGGGGSQITQEVNSSGSAFVNARFAETGSIFSLSYSPENSVGAGDTGLKVLGSLSGVAGNTGFDQLRIAFSAVTGHVTSLNTGSAGYQYVFDSGTFTISSDLTGSQYTGGSLVGIGGNAANTAVIGGVGGNSNLLSVLTSLFPTSPNVSGFDLRDSTGASLASQLLAGSVLFQATTTNTVDTSKVATVGNCGFGDSAQCAQFFVTSEGAANLVRAVPEPGSVALVGLALGGLGLTRLRGKKRSA